MYEHGTVSALRTDIDAQLRWAKGNRAVMVGDSILAIGTILDGIYGVDKKGHLLWHLNRDNQLNNNSVMGLFGDREIIFGQHWMMVFLLFIPILL